MGQFSNIRDAFTTNRAEELGLDVWDEFVIPLFFQELDLVSAKKARRIVGGRGSGKTMLLRYLSHHSQFSSKRNLINEHQIQEIGLYWRADTNFLPMLKKQGLDEDVWVTVFKHYLTLVTSIELLKSLESIANSNFKGVGHTNISEIDFNELSDYDGEISGKLNDFSRYLKKKLRQCESAIHNPKLMDEMHFLPDSFVTEGVIHCITNSLPVFTETTFHFFVDEYENLLEYQQRTINTKIKHGKSPLIFHIAMKRNGMETNKTLGDEKIQGIADFRNIDLDDLISEQADFELFAAEIFLQRISAKSSNAINFDTTILKEVDRIDERLTQEYRKKTINTAKIILPGMTQQELAEDALKQTAYVKRLTGDITKLLEGKVGGKKYSASDFVVPGFEQASIISPVLLARDGNQVDTVYQELQNLIHGKSSKFTGWIQNNFIGSYLKLYRSYDRPCPFYSGFNTFTKLSRGNIRHFLELCNSVVIRCRNESEELCISVELQAIAVRSASEDILNEAPTYGRLGSRLRAFIFNLGHIFEFSQMRKTQSEAEVNHFSIKGGYSNLDKEDISFLNEAEKWGVLYLDKSTKDKDKSNPDSVEWVLNPIYAPFFFISYRKKRKLEFIPEQFKVLHSGSPDSKLSLEKSYRQKWELDSSEDPYSYKLL